jgi:hypothetical protein
VDVAGVELVVGEGKGIDDRLYPVRVTGIGRYAIELMAGDSLPASSIDLKLLVDFGDGGAGVGSHVRVAAREDISRPGMSGTRLRAVFTSLEESDRAHIEALLQAAAAGASGPYSPGAA